MAAALQAALVAGGPAISVAAAAEAAPVIFCLDLQRNLVTRKTAVQCRGKIVTDEEAKRLTLVRQEDLSRRIEIPQPSGAAPRSRPRQTVEAHATGFAVGQDSQGRFLVLTAAHAVRSCDTITINGTRHQPATAQLVTTDGKQDLALLKTRYPFDMAGPLAADQKLMKRRDLTYLAGFPEGIPKDLKPQISLASNLGLRESAGLRFLALDTVVKPGHSGSPVVNRHGQIIGMVIGRLQTTNMYDKRAVTGSDLGVAISADQIRSFLTRNGQNLAEEAAPEKLPEGAIIGPSDTAKLVARVTCKSSTAKLVAATE